MNLADAHVYRFGIRKKECDPFGVAPTCIKLFSINI